MGIYPASKMKTAKRLNNIKEYYFSRKLREVGEMIKVGKPIINMGIGSPDLDPHPDIVKLLKNQYLSLRPTCTKIIREYQNLENL